LGKAFATPQQRARNHVSDLAQKGIGASEQWPGRDCYEQRSDCFRGAGVRPHRYPRACGEGSSSDLTSARATPGREASDLAAQLPPELAEELLASEGPQRFDSQEFYRRVAAEEGSGCTEQEARQHARAVTAALREAVGAEYLHLLDQLPEDYSDLMHTENVQH
jgi:hypothetical protein